MKITKIRMTNKWRESTELSEEFKKDLDVLAKFVKKDYQRIGLGARLWFNKGTLDFSIGNYNDFWSDGFLEATHIFEVKFGDIEGPCRAQIAKQMVTIHEIYLLLEKHGYAYRVEGYRHPYDAHFDPNKSAQAELMSLNLI